MITFDVPARLSGKSGDFINALRTVIDPELDVNIVDLGLIYSIKLDEIKMRIELEMTLSSKFCPMGESILSGTKNCMERIFPDFITEVALVWEPEWSYEFISAEGIRALEGY
jgi:metal-sulfur cluster biosynthetic enzyme